MPTLEKRNVRRLFAVVLILLPLHYGLVGLASLAGWPEPWPAVLLPGFQSVWDHERHIEMPEAALEVRFADGTMDVAPVAAVFRPLPASHHLGILRRQFTPYSMSGTMRTEQGLRPGARRWLRTRIASLYGDRPIERVDVVWYRVRYGTDGVFLSASPVDTLILPLR